MTKLGFELRGILLVQRPVSLKYFCTFSLRLKFSTKIVVIPKYYQDMSSSKVCLLLQLIIALHSKYFFAQAYSLRHLGG